MENDAVLLERYALSRDAEAFAELVKRHSGLVYATALRVMRNEHDAEDVAQTCFLELARKATTVRKSVPGWLHVLTISRATDAIRAQATRRNHENGAAPRQKRVAPVWEDVSSLIDEAIAELPDELRLPVTLRFLEGRTQSEIATELAVNQSTVSRRLEKGIEKLRRRLRKAGIATSAALLMALLTENAVAAPPASLTASLGKIGLAGIGDLGATTSTVGLSANAKVGIGILIFLGGVAIVVALLWSPERGARSFDARQARPEPVRTEDTAVARPPVTPFTLAGDVDGMEVARWRKGRWGNPVSLRLIDVEGRGKVLEGTCSHGDELSGVLSLRGRWNVKERPLVAYDVRYRAERDVDVAVGINTTTYFESYVGEPGAGQAFSRIVRDMTEPGFKSKESEWVHSTVVAGLDKVREICLLCFIRRNSWKEESWAGVLQLDNIRLVRGVFSLGSAPYAPPPADPRRGIAHGDFDGDGIMDRLALGPPVTLERGNGDGTFAPLRGARGIDPRARSAAWADVDRDGFLDLVTLGGETGPLSILLGDGSGSFADATNTWMLPGKPITARIDRVCAGDAEPDNDTDLWLLLEDGKWLFLEHQTPYGWNRLAFLDVRPEYGHGQPCCLTLRDAGGRRFGARMLHPYPHGHPADSPQVLYSVPEGRYTLSVSSPGRETFSRPVSVRMPGQRVAVTRGEVTELWPRTNIEIDGVMSPGEWDHARTIGCPLEYLGVRTKRVLKSTMTLWYQASPYALYLCAKVEGEDLVEASHRHGLAVYFDNDGDGKLGTGDDIKRVSGARYRDNHVMFADGVERANAYRIRGDPSVNGAGARSHSTGGESGHYVYELRMPWHSGDLDDLNVTRDTTLGIKVVFRETKRVLYDWYWDRKASDGWPDREFWRGGSYAKLTVKGLTRKPGQRPGPVEVEIRTDHLKP